MFDKIDIPTKQDTYMLYINNPKQSYLTYEDVVQAATRHGVEAKRVYIYLAALGVKSALARVISADEVDYLPSQKVAVKDGAVVSKVSTCEHCGELAFDVSL